MEQKRHGVSAGSLPVLGHGEVAGVGRGCLIHTHRTAATCCGLPVTQWGWAELPGCCRCRCYCCSAAVLRSSAVGPWTHRNMHGFCLWTDGRTEPTVWSPQWQVMVTESRESSHEFASRSFKKVNLSKRIMLSCLLAFVFNFTEKTLKQKQIKEEL